MVAPDRRCFSCKPDTGSAMREREKRIAHLLSRLAYFQGIPAPRREAESADEGEETCRALLPELEAPEFPGRRGHANIEIVNRVGREVNNSRYEGTDTKKPIVNAL